MLDRLKTALVESFAGAIAIGFLLSEGIMRVAYIFSEPVTRWILERIQQEQNSRDPNSFAALPRFPFEMAIPELFTALFLLVMAFVLLRWLYLPPAEKQDQDQTPEPEQGA
jgi:predicted Kef-type K+ transport protein